MALDALDLKFHVAAAELHKAFARDLKAVRSAAVACDSHRAHVETTLERLRASLQASKVKRSTGRRSSTVTEAMVNVSGDVA
jgi:hypothetical protein